MDDATRLHEAADVVAAAGSPEAPQLTAPRYDDPLTDAFSVAAIAAGGKVSTPDAAVERDLHPDEAIVTASGLFSSPPPTMPDWPRHLWGPAVVDLKSGNPKTLLPKGGGARVVTPGDRTVRRLRRGRWGVPATSGHAPVDATVVSPELPTTTSWWRMVAWSVRAHRGVTGMLLALAVVGGIAGLLLPITTQALYTTAVPYRQKGKALAVLAAFAVASAGAAVVFFARNLMVIRLRDLSDATLSPGLLARALRLPAGFFRSRSTGDVLNRVLSVEQARTLIDDSVPVLILTAAFGVVNLAFLLAIDLPLGAWISVVVALTVSISVFLQVRARESLRARLSTRSDADALLMALVQAIVPIRVAGAEARAFGRLAILQARAVDALATRMHRSDRVQPVDTAGPLLVNVVLVAAVIGIGTDFPASEFMPVYAAVVQLTVAMTVFSQNVVRLGELGPVISRALPLVTTPLERPATRRRPGPLGGAVELRDVVFGYDPDAPPLLTGLSLAVEPGEFVAIVGPSGSGKSTLVRLLLGFEDPWSGVVSYDGQDLAGLDVAAVRRQLGTVLQSSQPFGETFRECVCGPLHVPDDELWAILERAGLDEDVRRQPLGLDAGVAAGGGTISGGQRQRLMIARALVGDPRIVILDEATSALDNVTQDIVMRTILGLDATRIAIAHRLTTVERADRVVVIDSGQIVEQGSPAELLRSGGHFARLAARQEI